jgi:hypothetical protein
MIATPQRPAEYLEPRNMTDLADRFSQICATHIKGRLRVSLEQQLSQCVKDAVNYWDKLAEIIMKEGRKWLETRPFDPNSLENTIRELNAISGAVHYFMLMQAQQISEDIARVVKNHHERYTKIVENDILSQVAEVSQKYLETPTLISTSSTEPEKVYRHLYRFTAIFPDLRDKCPYEGPMQ